MLSTKPKVLIVEDEYLIAMDLQDILEGAGYEVCGVAATEDEAVDVAQQVAPDALTVDFWLRQGNGVDAVERIQRTLSAAVVYVTGNVEEVTALRPDADCIRKPYRADRILARLERSLRDRDTCGARGARAAGPAAPSPASLHGLAS
ncbi:response regulator [Mangrovibrevibacter kandeliae]|uniref:response regulator n=1 Tax=Mangrovibrevibacter kandeliae TaxID=2968473 RepID=UPI0021178E58|nr:MULTISPECIES: response regulator [unclassified Aurantimonas]MCQ8783321.1 response regulator [Aurantimonas sp. CSK15Z-1]MCW4116165.1 response regulator [Aurantimonas sp. MSK8Z-1]